MAYAPEAIGWLYELARNAESEPVRLGAVRDLLDRAGMKVADELVVVPQEATNEALDAAILEALARRSNVDGSPGGEALDVDSSETPTHTSPHTDPPGPGQPVDS